MRTFVEKLEISNRECTIAAAKQAFAEAKRDAAYDAILADPDPKDTVH